MEAFVWFYLGVVATVMVLALWRRPFHEDMVLGVLGIKLRPETEQLRDALDDLASGMEDALLHVPGWAREKNQYDELVAWARDIAGERIPAGVRLPHAHSGESRDD